MSAWRALRQWEIDDGFLQAERYLGFGLRVEQTKRALLSFLMDARNRGKRIVGYGAPGKGNTLLNYCGIRTDFLEFTVDANPYKQGKYTPGTRIPIRAPEAIRQARPDYVLILPWNLQDEIRQQARLHQRVGRPLRRADPNSTGARLNSLSASTTAGRRVPKRRLALIADLLFIVTWRDIAIKYKQSMMGLLWAVLMPGIIVAAGMLVQFRMSQLSGRPFSLDALAAVCVKSCRGRSSSARSASPLTA